MNLLAWLIFAASALLEVGGDAVMRHGLRSKKISPILLGFLMLGGYGILVNTVRWDFSRLLPVYVGVFAFVSVLFGRLVFRETVQPSTWFGLALILTGCIVIQMQALRE